MLKLLIFILVSLIPLNDYAFDVAQESWGELMRNTAYIFTGQVTSVVPVVSDVHPHRVVTFQIESEHKGVLNDNRISFEIPGGPLNNDHEFLYIAGAPEFYTGSRYLVFIRRGPWGITPVANGQHSYFREISIGGETYYIDDAGQGVVSINDRYSFVRGPVMENKFVSSTDRYGNALAPDHFLVLDRHTELSPDEILSNASSCMTKDEVLSYLNDHVGNPLYSPDIQMSSSIQINRMISSPIPEIPTVPFKSAEELEAQGGEII